ncbi:MAG: twin-arginine translocase TatA/TatE family subunit [Candidatus Eremiobacteraeota bacterium]|nr:twin-arginine translocase TatA/TatE family subunit [Candidatus Eremiobacteraeota bacterium]
MLSPSDTILIFVVALLLFGPEHLPRIARQLGDAMRHVQATTNSFMSEMERAAAASERPASTWSPPPDDALRERTIETDYALEMPGARLHAEDEPAPDEPPAPGAPINPNPGP